MLAAVGQLGTIEKAGCRASMVMTLLWHWAAPREQRARVSSRRWGRVLLLKLSYLPHVDQPGAVLSSPASSACVNWDLLSFGGELCRCRATAVHLLRRFRWYRLSSRRRYMCLRGGLMLQQRTGYPSEHEWPLRVHRSGVCLGVSSLW